MGVPGFFLWLWKKYKSKKFVFDKAQLNKDCELAQLVNNIDELLIDANCLIHPQCFKTLDLNKKWKNIEKLENKMLDQIIEYITYLINYVGPKKVVYIAIDGVAPVAKIKQQRSRRFKSVKDRALFNSIKRKHKKVIDNSWNNAAITPGTPFMQKITQKILNFIKTTDFGNLKIIFSSANTPAEGEHKLLQYIRNKKEDSSSYAIYGLDADLIFLSLTTQRDNVFLLREAQHMGKIVKNDDGVEQFNYVSIDIMKQCIYDEITSLLDLDICGTPDYNNIINDFVFICYFLGNDFLPHIPSIDIKCYNDKIINGLDLLLKTYANTYINTHEHVVLIKKDGTDVKIVLNDIFLQIFLENLTAYESEFFVTNYNSKKFYKKKCASDDPYEIEMHKIDNLMFKIDNPIQLGKDSEDMWKYRYYREYFNCPLNQEDLIKKVCQSYYQGLLWVTYYYFDKCPSWEWYYPYNHAPFISDLSFHFKNYNINQIEFSIGAPLNPFEQLLCVLPPQCDYLLPKSYAYLMKSDDSPLIHQYPINFDQDMLYKNKYWQSIPFLPAIDPNLVKKIVKGRKVSKEEKKRNKLIKNYVFNND